MNENSEQKQSVLYQCFRSVNKKDKKINKDNIYQKSFKRRQNQLKISITKKSTFSKTQSINNIYNINNSTNNIQINNINNNNICQFKTNKSSSIKKSNIAKKIIPIRSQNISVKNKSLDPNSKNHEKQINKSMLSINKNMNVEKLNNDTFTERKPLNLNIFKNTPFEGLIENKNYIVFNGIYKKKIISSSRVKTNKINTNKMKCKSDIISIPCINCENLIEIDKLEKHSLNCIKVSEDVLSAEFSNKETFKINYKLKKLKDYIINIEKEEKSDNIKYLITALKEYIEKILNINKNNIENIIELKNILKNFTMLNTHINNLNFLILIDRATILVKEKIKILKNMCKSESIKNPKSSKNRNKQSEFENILNNKIKKLEKINLETQLEKNKVKNLRNSIYLKSLNFSDNSFKNNLYINSCRALNLDNNNLLKNSNSTLEISLDHKTHESFENNSFNSKRNKKNLLLREVAKIKSEKLNNSFQGQKIHSKMIRKEELKNDINESYWDNFILKESNKRKKPVNIFKTLKQKSPPMSIINEE